MNFPDSLNEPFEFDEPVEPTKTPTEAPPEVDVEAPQPTEQRSVFAMLLDPRSLQVLMAAGGGLLSLGLVVYLAAVGLFNNPLHVAVGMGVANLSLLAGGVWVARETRYKLAGRATAMLGCLLLPLHLWFYDAQGLVTLSEGGHLWMPALFCCVVYAGVARWLRDGVFVYPVVAGVALTSLLFLADASVDKFWQVSTPAACLVVLGAFCVHAKYLFPKASTDSEKKPVARDNFGLATYRAGHVVMATGLVTLLTGQVVGFFFSDLFASFSWYVQPNVAVDGQAKFVAALLTALASYTYLFSFALDRRVWQWTLPAAVTTLWTTLVAAEMLGFPFTGTLLVGLLAVVSMACTLLAQLAARSASDNKAPDLAAPLVVAGQVTGWAALLVTLGQFAAWFFAASVPSMLRFEMDLEFGLSALLVVAAHGLLAFFATHEQRQAFFPPLVGVGLGGLMLAGSVFAVLVGLPASALLLVLMLSVPAVLLAVATFGSTSQSDWLKATESTTLVMCLLALPMLLLQASLTLALVLAVLSALYAVLGARGRSHGFPVAALLGVVAVWHVSVVLALGFYLPLALVSVAGLVLTAVDRFRPLPNGWALGQGAVVLAGVAGALLAAQHLMTGEANMQLLAMLAVQTVVAFVSASVAAPGRGRHAFLVTGLLSAVMSAATVNAVSELSMAQRVELLSVAGGVALLVAAHVAWRNEQVDGSDEQGEPMVDLGMWFGMAVTVVPFAVGLLVARLGFFEDQMAWRVLHEVGALGVALALVVSGVLCRLRATTLGGASLLTVYVTSLVTLLRVPEQLQTTGVYLMVGGTACFTGALLLSVYRDRLMSLPSRIRDGEGVYAVLKWR